MDEVCSLSTPMATERLDAYLQGTPTDQTTYRRMIRGLMYLTASRPIKYAFALSFVCARYQARPTVKHLKEVKRIFWYLRQSYNMGLWYPKDSRFELIAYSDADHARCKDDCKSTSGGLQFLAEYVSLSACCAQVIWMRTQLLDYGYKYNRIPMYCDSKSAIAISCNPVQHSKTRHDIVFIMATAILAHMMFIPMNCALRTRDLILGMLTNFFIRSWILWAQFWHILKEDGSKVSASGLGWDKRTETQSYTGWLQTQFSQDVTKNKVGMQDTSWKITDEMKLQQHYRMCADGEEKRNCRYWLMRHLRHLKKKKLNSMVDEQGISVDDSSIPRNDEPNIPGTKIEPRSNKESPEVEIAKEKEVELTNVVILVNVNDEDEEITGEVILERQKDKEERIRLISKAILQERGNIRLKSRTQIVNAICLCHSLPKLIAIVNEVICLGHFFHVLPIQAHINKLPLFQNQLISIYVETEMYSGDEHQYHIDSDEEFLE
ncbi:hypothetical protein Tco_0846940 [Tanacetum coccineum]